MRHVRSRAGCPSLPSHAACQRRRGRGSCRIRRRARHRVAERHRFVILPAVIARARAHRGALWLLAATTIANVLGYGYQVVMARLLRPEDYAILIALFGILILESISSQVIQSATAKLAAQYRAVGDQAALHAFVRRWSTRTVMALAALAIAVVAFAGPL